MSIGGHLQSILTMLTYAFFPKCVLSSKQFQLYFILE